jgi:hypothetical protein
VQCVYGTGSGSKTRSKRFLNLKKCDRTSIEGFKFWKNLTQTPYPEKCLNVEIESKVLSKRKKRTTLV